MITVILQQNLSDNNVMNKTINDVVSKNANLLEPTNMLTPVLRLNHKLVDMKNINYVSIPELERSYFVSEIRSVSKDIVEVYCKIDVLYSYREQIKNCSGIVHKQENKFNLYLDDGTFKVYNNSLITTKKFPNGFKNHSYMLLVSG